MWVRGGSAAGRLLLQLSLVPGWHRFHGALESLRMLRIVFGGCIFHAMSRHLYLVGYDVADPKRLRRMLACVKRYATGGQRSVFECWLNDAERRDLLRATERLLRPAEDRFFLVRLDPRQKPVLLGLAEPIVDDEMFYLG